MHVPTPDTPLSSGESRSPRKRKVDPATRERALCTAFVARFIVLREGRRSRAHRVIEDMVWTERTTAKELYAQFRQAFIDNGDKLTSVDRDLRRAFAHAERSVDYFVDQYLTRGCLSFKQALCDYVRSNQLLFGDNPEDVPRTGGWRLPSGMTPDESED